MPKILNLSIAFLLSPVVTALAKNAQQTEKLIPQQSVALPWIVGLGILICTLIAGLKHPGRSHLN